MKKIIFAIAVFAASIYSIPAIAYPATAMKVGEIVDNQRQVRDCIYEFLGKKYVYSVGLFGQMCPMNIQVDAH